MKLQFRFLILYVFLFSAVAGGIFYQRSVDLNHSQQLLQSDLNQKHTYFDKIVSLDGTSLANLSAAFSSSDDLVSFIKSRNMIYARDNIDTSLKQYGADFAFVYTPDNTQIYSVTSDSAKDITSIGLPTVYFTHLYSDHLEHFFILRDDGKLLEVRAATVHPSDDIDGQTLPTGYIIVGRVWDSAYIKTLSNLTQSDLSFVKSSEAINGNAEVDKDTLYFDTKLSNWQDTPIGVLRAKVVVQSAKDLQNLYNKQLILLLVVTVSSIIVIVFSIWLLVIRPMNRISRSIKLQKPKDLDRMVLELDNEFGDLAQTVQGFFAQKVQIAEATVRQQELLKLNKAKEDFLAVAAHELNSPVSKIKIFSEFLAALLKKGVTTGPEVDKQLSRISHQAEKIGILIKDLRLASKGQQDLEFDNQMFNFDAFIREEVEEAQFTTQQKLIMEGATNLQVTSDISRLGQVVGNLIRNAAKYSPETGTITVRVHGERDQVFVEVQDEGIGIAPEEQSKVFDRFFRSKEVLTTYQGLGLGLSICKEIIEKMGGRIWVESEPKKGSRFYFVIPIQPPIAVSMLPTNPASAQPGTILKASASSSPDQQPGEESSPPSQ